MKILLTGGTGYIGSHVAVGLIEKQHKIAVIDNLFNSKEVVIDKIEKITGYRPDFYQVDLLDLLNLRKIFQENSFDIVIHFAGLKAVGESVEYPLKYYENNIVGTINLLKCMHEFDCKKIIFSSSATVYGEKEVEKFTEEMQTGVGITNPYGRTKYMIEEILKDVAAADDNFGVGILRYFNPIGAHESGLLGEDPNDTPNNLMPIIMDVYKKKIPMLSVYGNDYDTIDGSCVRDYIHVMDLAQGHIALIDKVRPGVQTYNLGTGDGTSVFQMIKAFERASGESLPYKIVGRRKGDLPLICADSSKAEASIGWKTKKTVGDAMNDTLRFLRNNS